MKTAVLLFAAIVISLATGAWFGYWSGHLDGYRKGVHDAEVILFGEEKYSYITSGHDNVYCGDPQYFTGEDEDKP